MNKLSSPSTTSSNGAAHLLWHGADSAGRGDGWRPCNCVSARTSPAFPRRSGRPRRHSRNLKIKDKIAVMINARRCRRHGSHGGGDDGLRHRLVELCSEADTLPPLGTGRGFVPAAAGDDMRAPCAAPPPRSPRRTMPAWDTPHSRHRARDAEQLLQAAVARRRVHRRMVHEHAGAVVRGIGKITGQSEAITRSSTTTSSRSGVIIPPRH